MQEEQLFNTIYQQHYPKVFRLSKGYFNGDAEQAGDAAQEAFIKVWQNLANFRHEAAIGTWIYKITVNSCLLQLRKINAGVKNVVSMAQLPEMAGEEYNASIDQQLAKMYACIQQLDETGKLIILMVLEGIDYNVIAEVVGISEETLRVKIHRIKKNLSNCVKL